MTSTKVKIDDLPPLNVFLSSVSPGIDKLEENVHFLHEDYDGPEKTKLASILWPLNDSSNINDNPDLNTTAIAKLNKSYLNISRGPLNPGPGIFESNTYVSLPYHITNLFDKVIKYKTQNKTVDGGFQIGANVGSLMPDPFEYVQLNPGCLSEIIELDNNHRNGNGIITDESKNPFTKLTNNFNKFLKFPSSHSNATDSNSYRNFVDLIPAIPKSCVFDKVVNFDSEVYYKTLKSIDTTKLLVACNVNVINVIGIDSSSNYTNTTSYQSTKPYVSLLEIDDRENKDDQDPKSFSYKKTIEVPILRLQLHHKLIITSMKLFKTHDKVAYLVFGLNSGELIVLNLQNLTYLKLGNFANEISKTSITLSSHLSANNLSTTILNECVTGLEIIDHPIYDFLVIAGYSNGEIVILNPFINEDIKTNYTKTIIDKDRFVTYFKKFDLSGFQYKTKPLNGGPDDTTAKPSNGLDDDNSLIVGHFKVSHLPITSISSTISIINPSSSSHNPHLVAIGGSDGLVRIINLSFTFNSNYGSSKKCIISDIISSYLQDGIQDIKFSNDFKFLAIVGNGDLVELFKLSYYNVNSILSQHKTSNQNQNQSIPSGRRSRSGTTNSIGSNNPPSMGNFLSPSANSYSHASPSTSLDIPRNTHDDATSYPPVIKELKLACRLKGHSNSICKIFFVRPDQIISNKQELTDSNSFYRLISCGNDGKVIFWEFDYKALPKIKKIIMPRKKVSQPIKRASSNINNNNPMLALRGHSKTKSEDGPLNLPSMTNISQSLHGSVQNMNSLLTAVGSHKSSSNVNLSDSDPLKNVISLYGSLYEMRSKRHYTKLLVEQHKLDNKSNLPSIVHPIINDKLVPSIEIPLSEIDFTYWFKDGKISNIYVDEQNFWCMGRNGDIIKYDIE